MQNFNKIKQTQREGQIEMLYILNKFLIFQKIKQLYYIREGNNMSKKDQQQIKILKVIIIGDSGVGKTNLLTTFCEGKFRQSYVATIGVDFKIKMLNIDGSKVKLQIWDTAGQQRFRTIAQTYYKGAAGIILTYAINSSTSFRSINSWLKQIQSHASQNVCKMLIGTKNDLQSERQVSYEQGKSLALKYGLHFQEVSAKNGFNVNEVFIQMAKMMKNQRQNQDIGTSGSVKLHQHTDNTKSCAC